MQDAGYTYVYALVDPRDLTIRYVGRSSDPHLRLVGHLGDSGVRRCSVKGLWIRELCTAGLRPQVRILERVAIAEAHAREQELIVEHESLFLTNATRPGRTGRNARRDP